MAAKQQSFSLSEETVEELTREAERRGLKKSQLVDQILKSDMLKDDTEKKPTVITVMSFKGGVAKTTTSGNLAIFFGRAGYRVLVVDLDGQGSISQYLNVYDPEAQELCIADIMLANANGDDRLGIDDVVKETPYENVYIVPSSFRFTGADTRMHDGGAAGIDTRLCRAIQETHDSYDFIIIDCPPSLELTVTNAITAQEAGNKNSMIIIPVKVDGFAIAGLSQTIKSIERVGKDRGVTPYRWKILQTVVERNTSAYKVGIDLIKQAIKRVEFFNTTITKGTVVPESTLAMEPLAVFKPSSKQALEYSQLADEIMNMTVLD